MSYYEPQGWQAPVRQTSWEQPAPPSRSGTSSASQREETTAFSSQFDEVDRAVDNLVKSGKLFNNNASRRESVPMMMGRQYPEYDPRGMGGGPQRHHSISEYDPSRSHSASNIQGFYASQRYQSRPSEAEQMMQAKRRMAAQRERELRNYHQEQQYNRSLITDISGNKSDRSMSPAAMSEESRRELIARQHRALYGNDSAPFYPNGSIPEDSHNRPEGQSSGIPTTVPGVARGQSSRGVDPFGLGQNQGQGSADGAAPATSSGPSPAVAQARSRANSTSSPVAGNNPNFGAFESNQGQQQVQTSTSSPGGAESPSSIPSSTPTAGAIGSAVGPIGSRPSQQGGGSQAGNPALSKRSTTPLPSPLGYGFAPNEAANNSANAGSNGNDRSTTSNSSNQPPTTSGGSNPGMKESSGGVGLGWGNGNGVWGSKNPLGVQASVWG